MFEPDLALLSSVLIRILLASMFPACFVLVWITAGDPGCVALLRVYSDLIELLLDALEVLYSAVGDLCSKDKHVGDLLDEGCRGYDLLMQAILAEERKGRYKRCACREDSSSFKYGPSMAKFSVFLGCTVPYIDRYDIYLFASRRPLIVLPWAEAIH